MANLSFGMQGPEIGNWQRFLNSIPLCGQQLLFVDEDFGGATRDATASFQNQEKLFSDGIVGPLTRKRAMEQGFIPFVQARNYTPAPAIRRDVGGINGRTIELLVIHTMEAPDKPDTAENVAAWFAGPNAPKASAHYCVDGDSLVQCVRDRDIAWHAPGANHNGIGIEHAGYAKQSPGDWGNPYNQAMLERSAKLASRLCKEYTIPIEYPAYGGAGPIPKGIYGHVDITNYLNNGIGHTDPGPNFPWELYLELIRNN